VAGLPAAVLVADEMDKSLRLELRVADGATVEGGEILAVLAGPVRSMLAAERILLNLLGRLCGIATLTRQYVDAVAGTKARIYDTRKTTPGWRRLEKYAVRQGGAHNHRMGLYEAVLIKDNHLAYVAQEIAAAHNLVGKSRGMDARTIAPAVAVHKVREFLAAMPAAENRSGMIVEVEVDSLAQLEAALGEQPDIVLLDNMSVKELGEAVSLRDSVSPLVELEASGGVSLLSVRKIAETGVDRISVGALTHSAVALDVALDWL
jgi:nicotinate-nucleotide pyrophosphorylase (carboxylating)